MNNQFVNFLSRCQKMFFLWLFIFIESSLVHAQKNAQLQIKTVFDQLVVAYANAKTAPQLQFMNTNPKPETPAFFKDKNIKVDLELYTLCQTFGKDSLNALSAVLSHELAHYYYDHSFCSDFAFAIKNKSQDFSKAIKLVNKNQKIIYETQADDKGLFYAAIAGFAPFDVQPKILDAIYQHYQLSEAIEGYPTKNERKAIAQNALTKTQKLCAVFKEALKAQENKNYNQAIILFEEINRDFPSRENYNNTGVLKTLQALQLKVLTKEEFDFPQRFLYPLEIENKSRLNQTSTRSTQEQNQEQMTLLLKNAQKDFEKAISLDTNYTRAYINLACVFDLLENPEAAIGKIKELPLEQQKTKEALQILAIAYYHADNEAKAQGIWKLIKI